MLRNGMAYQSFHEEKSVKKSRKHDGVSDPRTVVVTAALPVELGTRLDYLSRTTGISKTRLIIDALKAHLDIVEAPSDRLFMDGVK